MQIAMLIKEYEIDEFQNKYQQSVEDLILPIQQHEFSVGITREEQNDLVDIKGVFQKGNGNFWVVVHKGRVVGTIGLVDIGNNQVALKKMFVHKEHRGKQSGIAAALMASAKQWCKERGIQRIYLGTVAQMTAAHRFYEKNGFNPLEPDQLPPEFPIVHVDTKFFFCEL